MDLDGDTFCLNSDYEQQTLTIETQIKICSSAGASLILPTSETSLQTILNVLEQEQGFVSAKLIGIGITDEAVEQTWTDLNGNPLTYTNWDFGGSTPQADTTRNNGIMVVGSLASYNGKWQHASSSDQVKLACSMKLTTGKKITKNGVSTIL